MRKRSVLIALLGLLVIAASSCSNTRVLTENQYRLASNKVAFEGDASGLSSSEVSSYIKQQTKSSFILGWIYNWSDPAKDNWINRALRKIGSAPVVFNGRMLNGSKENICRHLDYLGYYGSSVRTRVDTVKKNVRVTYYVSPGKRIKIDSLVFKLPEGEFSEEFDADRKNVLVKQGGWLSEQALETESARSAAYLRNKGYYNLTKFNYFFEADTLGPRTILTYEIRNYTRNEPEVNAEPLRKYHLGNVNINYPETLPFRGKVLTDINILKPGDLYSEQRANVNYNRYTALRLFSNVAIEMTPVDSVTVDCNINLTPSKLKGVKLNLEASTSSNGLFGVSPAVNFYNKNIFHGGEWLTLGFSGNFQRKFGTDLSANEFGITGSISFPKFIGLPYKVFSGANIPRTLLQASFNFQDRPEFKRSITTASWGYTGNSGIFYYQVNPVRATVVKVNNVTDEFQVQLLKNPLLYDSFYDHIDAGLSAQLYLTSDSSVIPKTSYWYARLGLDLAGNAISLFDKWLPHDGRGNKLIFGLAYSRYFKTELTLAKNFRFSPGSALAMRLTGGIGLAFGEYGWLPFEKQLYVGGASSMRGWQVRSLGPGSSQIYEMFTIASQTGNSKLEFDVEYRQKLFWKFEGAVFAEVGNIWLTYEELDSTWAETLAGDWGIGLRLNLDFILLRLDWGMKVYDPSIVGGNRWLGPGQWFSRNGSTLHFGVGYPF
ncbi:MAG: BamA/TamA family outer membrane protein [Bacteroidales bacterium]|nr:BamA/TamA family outer membrane protein [Bacteroidales bacterium]